ncbi:MAG: protein phosphatase 2C domain-containing protein [Chitinophagaceae bacterium]
MERLLTSGNTHPGRRRKENQDACIVKHLWTDEKALAVVIDGVGGYAGGERATAIAKDCIEQYMQVPSGDTLTMLREAVIFANNQIAEERKKDQKLSAMCCVLTALVADTLSQRIYFVHVGDTRLYRYRDGKIQKLTRDHSVVGIREDAGEITEKEAMAHPHRNQILREVGSALHRLDDEDFMEYGCDALVPGDLLLLCSDGLTDMITSHQITRVLSTNQPLINKTGRLVELANECGGHDNITVVLLQYPVSISIEKITSNIVSVSTNTETFSNETNKKKDRQWTNAIFVPAVLLLILIAAASWYFSTPKKVLATDDRHPVSAFNIPPDSSRVKTMARVYHPVVQGPPTLEKTDTLRISSTQNFADLKKYADSTGSTIVLVPKKYNSNHFAAVAITGRSAKPGDTLLVSNLRLIGFENGIDIHLPILLKAENLVFENTTNPFRYLFKPGEKQASLLFMNIVKQ